MDTPHIHHGDGLTVSVEKEPLRSAFALESLVFPETGTAPALEEDPQALRIEHMSRFRRMEAAVQADVLLARATKRYRENVATSTACELVTALGVWAVTRVHLGLFSDASLALDRSLDWVREMEQHPIYAAEHRRAARVQDAIRNAQPYLAFLYEPERLAKVALECSTKAGDETAVAAARIDLARVLIGRDPERALALLDDAPRTDTDTRPELIFEARETQVLAHLHRGDHYAAGETSMKLCLNPGLDDFQKYRWFRLHTQVHRARKRRDEALRLALMAATSGDELDVGPEMRLRDLLQLDHLCAGRSVGPETASEIRRLVRVLIPAVAPVVKSDAWRENLYHLESRMLDGASAVEGDTLPRMLECQLELWHQEQIGPAGIRFQKGPTTEDSVTEELHLADLPTEALVM